MKTIIHVNQHKIKANRKDGGQRPVLTCKTYKDNRYAHEAIILDKKGVEVGRFIYRPEEPLSCGAHVWFETANEVRVVVKGVDGADPLGIRTGVDVSGK